MISHLQPIFGGSWETRATEKGKKYYLLMTHWRCLSQKQWSHESTSLLCLFVKNWNVLSRHGLFLAMVNLLDWKEGGLIKQSNNQFQSKNKMINRLKPDWWGIHFVGFRPSVIFQLQSGSNLPEPWLWARLRSRLGSKTGESLNLKIFCFLA